MATSQNGWDALSSDSKLLHTWTIPDAPRTKLRLRNGSGGFLLIHLATWFDRKLEDIDFNYNDGQLDDWAYAYRAVRGYETTLSNHSSGTAIDLNATEHPLGREGTFSPKEMDAIRKRLRLYGGCVRWGGDFNGRKDEMHFELNRPLPDCERVARKLLDTPVGKEILAANPGQKAIILS